MMRIRIQNVSTVISDADLGMAMVAWQQQISRDFAPIWGLDALLVRLARGDSPEVGESQLVVADDSTQGGALGYHETTKNGDPIGYLFAKTDLDSGYSWTITGSHELLEMLADPFINQVAEVDNQDGSMLFYALEVCDACEDDAYGYLPSVVIGQVLSNGKPPLVSDFVTPAYFQSPAPNINKAFDVRGFITEPLQILEGGYLSILRYPGKDGWQQVTEEKKTKRLVPGGKEQHVGSRRL